MNINPKRIGILLTILAATLLASMIAPQALEAGAKHEYKFVRLVDDGPMPSITEALNREAERGWRLEQMEVVPGEPGSIYLVFVK